MLDRKARKYVQPTIKKIAMFFVNRNISANGVTVIALLVGLIPAVLFYYTDYAIIAVAILWLSGLLDAIDGTVARITNTSSSFGTIMDLVFDRVVEISLIIAFALKFPDAHLVLIFLEASIILSMTIFLSVGAASKNDSEKSFHYQAGIAERTEGFIFFSLAMIFSQYLVIIMGIFTALILYTAVQRFVEAKKIL